MATTIDISRSASASRALRLTAILYAAGYLMHSVDHVGRGLDLTPVATFWAGTVGLLPAGFAVWLVYTDHRFAAPYAVLTGALTAVFATLIHVPPRWSTFSEPFRTGVGLVDWLTLAAMVGGAVAFAAAGLVALRRRDGAR
jgi:hypothetical protein